MRSLWCGNGNAALNELLWWVFGDGRHSILGNGLLPLPLPHLATSNPVISLPLGWLKQSLCRSWRDYRQMLWREPEAPVKGEPAGFPLK